MKMTLILHLGITSRIRNGRSTTASFTSVVLSQFTVVVILSYVIPVLSAQLLLTAQPIIIKYELQGPVRGGGEKRGGEGGFSSWGQS